MCRSEPQMCKSTHWGTGHHAAGYNIVMHQKVNEEKEPVYKGILGPVWGNRRIIPCDPCAEVSTGVAPSSNVLSRHRMPTVSLALVEITWVGTCRLCGQRYYADLANWPNGYIFD